MNRLWVRIALSFTVTVIFLISLVAVWSAHSTDTAFRGYLARSMAEEQPALVRTLAEYYQSHGSWEGVEALLPNAAGRHGGRGHPPFVILADAEGRVIVGSSSTFPGTHLDAHLLRDAVPIRVRGQMVGYLIFVPPGMQGHRLPEHARAFLTHVQRTLLFTGALAVLLGTIVAIIISRTATAPLQRLVSAARSIGHGDFDRRVPEEGPEEVAEVARAFNEMAHRLKQAEETERQMLADIAHELRTPLSVLQANLQAMLDGVYPLSQAEIAALYDETRLLNRLVEDLQDLALADMGRLSLRRERVDLRGLIQTAVSVFEPAAEARGVELVLDVAENLPPVVGDSERLAQILRNLLSNALRHTPAGGRITLRAYVPLKCPDRVRVEVSDTGEGIPAEMLPHVFDRFWRADSSRARMTGGSGLGLAIARALVEAHGGDVGVESEVGHGTTFWFTLPRLSGGNPHVKNEGRCFNEERSS